MNLALCSAKCVVSVCEVFVRNPHNAYIKKVHTAQ